MQTHTHGNTRHGHTHFACICVYIGYCTQTGRRTHGFCNWGHFCITCSGTTQTQSALIQTQSNSWRMSWLPHQRRGHESLLCHRMHVSQPEAVDPIAGSQTLVVLTVSWVSIRLTRRVTSAHFDAAYSQKKFDHLSKWLGPMPLGPKVVMTLTVKMLNSFIFLILIGCFFGQEHKVCACACGNPNHNLNSPICPFILGF